MFDVLNTGNRAGEAGLVGLLNRSIDDPLVLTNAVLPAGSDAAAADGLAEGLRRRGSIAALDDLNALAPIDAATMTRLRTLAISGVFAPLAGPFVLQDGDPQKPDGPTTTDDKDDDEPTQGSGGLSTVDPEEDERLEQLAITTGCTQIKRVVASPSDVTRNTASLNELEQFDQTLLGILRGFVLGLETFVRKSKLLVAASQQQLDQDLRDSNDSFRQVLGRDLNMAPVEPDSKNEFKSGPNKTFERNSIPGVAEMDKARADLRKLKGGPKKAKEGRDSNLQEFVTITVEFTRPQPGDVGRPVEIMQSERVDSRINTPLTRIPRIADVTIEGVKVVSQVLGTLPFKPGEEVFPRRAIGRATVPLPESGRLTGTAKLFGNYGSTVVGAIYTCQDGSISRATAVINVSGLSEQQVRAAEDARNERTAAAIQLVNDRVTMVRNGMTIINGIIDTLAGTASFIALIPFIGQLLSSFFENFGNVIENLLQGLEAGLESLTLARLQEWRLINTQIRNANLTLAESYPESGVPGQVESVGPLPTTLVAPTPKKGG